jgi:tetratricopeptide (TPR) repeat protein
MKPIFLSVLFSLSVAMAGAQEYDPEKMDKKAVSLFNEAQAKAEDGDFSQAISLAKKAIDKEKKFLDAWVFLAFVYSNDKQHSESIKAYETAFAIDSIYSREYKLPYSINLAGLGRFEDALNAVNGLLAATRLNPNTRKAAEYRKRSYEFAIDHDR